MLWIGLRRFLEMIIYDFALGKHLGWRRWGECENEYDPSKNGLLRQMGGLVKMLEVFIREKVWISEGMRTVKHTEIIGQCGYSAST